MAPGGGCSYELLAEGDPLLQPGLLSFAYLAQTRKLCSEKSQTGHRAGAGALAVSGGERRDVFFLGERIFNLKIDDVGYFYVVFPQFSTTFSPVCVVQSKFWIVKHMKPLVSLFFSNRQLGVKKPMEKTMALQLLEPSGGLSGPPGQPLGAALRHREGGRGWLFLATGGGSM